MNVWQDSTRQEPEFVNHARQTRSLLQEHVRVRNVQPELPQELIQREISCVFHVTQDSFLHKVSHAKNAH
jgi:tRNA splicing ligase